jgi:hypothetical protein
MLQMPPNNIVFDVINSAENNKLNNNPHHHHTSNIQQQTPSNNHHFNHHHQVYNNSNSNSGFYYSTASNINYSSTDLLLNSTEATSFSTNGITNSELNSSTHPYFSSSSSSSPIQSNLIAPSSTSSSSSSLNFDSDSNFATTNTNSSTTTNTNYQSSIQQTTSLDMEEIIGSDLDNIFFSMGDYSSVSDMAKTMGTNNNVITSTSSSNNNHLPNNSMYDTNNNNNQHHQHHNEYSNATFLPITNQMNQMNSSLHHSNNMMCDVASSNAAVTGNTTKSFKSSAAASSSSSMASNMTNDLHSNNKSIMNENSFFSSNSTSSKYNETMTPGSNSTMTFPFGCVKSEPMTYTMLGDSGLGQHHQENSFSVGTSSEVGATSFKRGSGMTMTSDVAVVKTKNGKTTIEKRYGPIVVRPRRHPAPTLASGRKSKYTTLDQDEEMKRELRRRRNRQAAEKCKLKRYEIETKLEADLTALLNERKSLDDEYNSLLREKLKLEQMFSKHVDYSTCASPGKMSNTSTSSSSAGSTYSSPATAASGSFLTNATSSSAAINANNNTNNNNTSEYSAAAMSGSSSSSSYGCHGGVSTYGQYGSNNSNIGANTYNNSLPYHNQTNLGQMTTGSLASPATSSPSSSSKLSLYQSSMPQQPSHYNNLTSMVAQQQVESNKMHPGLIQQHQNVYNTYSSQW